MWTRLTINIQSILILMIIRVRRFDAWSENIVRKYSIVDSNSLEITLICF